MWKKLILLNCFLLFSLAIFAQGEDLFNEEVIHEIRLNFEQNGFWNSLLDNYSFFYPNIPYIIADATIDGNAIDSIGVRLKGFSSFWGDTDKKSIKLDFNKFVSGKKYDGLKKINLNNGEGDPAMQRDMLCYDLLRRSGVNAPRTAYAKVYLNDEYWGLYLLVEQIDKTFIRNNFANAEGNLFKNINNSALEDLGSDSAAYQEFFELKLEGEPGAWKRFIELVDVINNTPQNQFKEAIENIFDVDLFLRNLVVDVATDNWDSYLEHGRNYYMYEDPVTKKFMWIPWDYNLAVGGTFSFFGGPVDYPEECFTIVNEISPYPADDSIFIEVINQNFICCDFEWDESCQNLYDDIYANGVTVVDPTLQNIPIAQSNSSKLLISKILRVPSFADLYYKYWCRFLDNHFTTERIFPIIEENGDLIREAITTDPNYIFSLAGFEADLDRGSAYIPGLKFFFEERKKVLTEKLENLQDCGEFAATIDFNEIVINEFMASNDSLSGIADPAGEFDDWIELYNTSDIAIDLSNAFLSDDPNNPALWSFPEGTLIPAGEYLIIWADRDNGQEGLHADFKLAKSGEYIQLTDGNQVIDSLSYGEQITNLSAARMPNGSGPFEITEPTFNAFNGLSNLENIFTNPFKIFPNPTSDNIQIEFSMAPKQQVQAELYNAVGHQIRLFNLTQRTAQLDLSGVSAGIYFLRINDGENEFGQSQKLTILRSR